jgi:hypothetical protein
VIAIGYHGGSLTDLISMENMEPPTERMLHAVADDAGEVMTDAAKRATPKDRGVVAASWRTLPTEKVPSVMGDAYESGTTNPHWVARFLEYGVEPHFIGPKTAKALGLDVGPRGGAHHPGIRAHHMTAHAAVEVEARLDQIAEPHLSDWQRRIEGGASKSR